MLKNLHVTMTKRCFDIAMKHGESTGVCWRSNNDDVFLKKNNVRFLFIRNERETASEDAYLNFEQRSQRQKPLEAFKRKANDKGGWRQN